MRYLLVICCLFPCFAFAQTQKDYEHAVARFVQFYNHSQADSIINMWPAEERPHLERMWTGEQIASRHKEYGKIVSARYIGIDKEDPNPGLAVFKTRFSIAGEKTMSLTLEKDNYLATFRFITSSDGIDKMLKEGR